MMAGSIEKPEDVFNFGLAHEEQVKLVHSCQDALLKEQITLIDSVVETCPNCPDRKLVKYGKRCSDYHDVFTVKTGKISAHFRDRYGLHQAQFVA